MVTFECQLTVHFPKPEKSEDKPQRFRPLQRKDQVPKSGIGETTRND